MRSALLCVFLALVVQDGSRAENEDNFRPTPIPLSDWPRDKQEAAGTLQEIIKTEAPTTKAAVPAHYWEDALRHSVYLTLVRDKIDQLIAKRDISSPDVRLDDAQEINDRGVWEKIKTAPFDRQIEQNIPPGDVVILARGRLLEDSEGYRFIEDDFSRNNCSENNCLKGAKAFWSVKRIKQGETSPGKYSYELTFSVTSQSTRKVKTPYKTQVRTFTMKENSPAERPQVRNYEQIYYNEKPKRTMWVHKNINNVPNYRKLPLNSDGLDRIFSSLFSDEDSFEEPSHRHKQKNYFPQVYPQHSKVGYVEEREPNHQKKLIPYALTKPQSNRYTHPPIPPPPLSYVQHPYFNVGHIGKIPYVPMYTDNRYVPSNVVKTTRPAVLPTPITNYPLLKESTIEVPVKTKLNATEYTTKMPDVVTTYKIYNHPKQSPMKVSYFPDHIRPPVYNAPPGVFVTMDKKPFKPMPPLKHNYSGKPQKTMPFDFRPSPQILDSELSEQDNSADTAFRPITMGYTELSNVKGDKGEKGNKNIRKPSTAKKPTKKHENIKSHHLTTVTPEIITAQSQTVEEDTSMEWANILGAFTKTTPMASHRERGTTENSDPITATPLSTTPLSTTITTEASSEEYEDSSTSTTTTTTTTTPKPKKRTRPPPKFTKPEKIRKHKRVTSTTTATTKPTRTYPVKKLSGDLTPQASSAATSGINFVWESNTHKASSTTTTTTSSTTPRTTTTIKLTTTSTSTTTSPSSTTVEPEQPIATTQPKSKNRFRQSTLMTKGTSVNHDKWSTTTLEKNRTTSVSSHSLPMRRKASKFQGYIPASTPRSPEVERHREDHRDHAYNSNTEHISSTTTEKNEDILVKVPQTTGPTFGDRAISNEPPSDWPQGDQTEEYSDNEAEQNEYIFPTASITHTVKSEYISLEKQPTTTEVTVVASPHSAAKNKTKCKKKKHNNLATTQGALEWSNETETTTIPINISTTTSSTTASAVTSDIFDELFGGFTMDDATEKPETERSTPPPEQNKSQSEKHERYVHMDDDIEDFLHSLDQKSNNHAEDDESDEEYEDDEDSPFNNSPEIFDSRDSSDEYYDEGQETKNGPLSLLDWAME